MIVEQPGVGPIVVDIEALAAWHLRPSSVTA